MAIVAGQAKYEDLPYCALQYDGEIKPKDIFGDGGAEVTLIRDRTRADEVSQLPEMPEIRNLSIGYCHCHCDGEKVVMAGNGSF